MLLLAATTSWLSTWAARWQSIWRVRRPRWIASLPARSA
jgi:hypothetical protein